MMSKGMIYVFVGDGKGKTSAALGTAVRFLGNGGSVLWFSWFKQLKWDLSEAKVEKNFKGKLKMFFEGEGFYFKESGSAVKVPDGKAMKIRSGGMVKDTASKEVHRSAAKKVLDKATKVLQGSSPPGLMILDEVLRALGDGLITMTDLRRLMEARKSTHLVMTGHSVNKKIEQMADLVSEIKKIKHPYDRGVLAVKGLDY